jgi:hypothetical protein
MESSTIMLISSLIMNALVVIDHAISKLKSSKCFGGEL